jgi:mannose-1-phosphate guanylyltransferase
MAGGDGNRLQPFIKNLLDVDLPKQYVSFLGTRSMLEHTIERAEQLIARECLFTVVARDHLSHPEVRRQLRDHPPHTLIAQPINRNTGPGLLLPLTCLFSHYPNSTVAVFPSDHFVLQEDLFIAYVQQAFDVIEHYPSKMVFLGAFPTRLDRDYGYILPENQDTDSFMLIKRVKSFVDKPAPQIAAQVTEIGALWNTMAIVFKPEVLLHLISLSAPRLHRFFRRVFKVLGTARESAAIEEIYRDMPSVDISKNLLEALDIHSRNQLYVLPMKDVFWSDWDTEDRIRSVFEDLISMNCRPNGFRADEMQDFLRADLNARFEPVFDLLADPDSP